MILSGELFFVMPHGGVVVGLSFSVQPLAAIQPPRSPDPSSLQHL